SCFVFLLCCQLTVLTVAKRYDLAAQVAGDELLQWHTQVHPLDADADVEGAGGVPVQTHAVEALLAVRIVVEAAGGAGFGQPDLTDLLEPHDPAGRQLVRGSAPGHP